jgi:branched-subunit amino acid transport protein
MSDMALIVALAAVTYGLRLGGLVSGPTRTSPAFQRLLGHVPVAVLAALVALGLSEGGADAEWLPRLAGAAVAALLVLRRGPLWLTLGAGMGAYWLVLATAGAFNE